MNTITYGTINIKSADVDSSVNIDFVGENNDEDPKFEISDCVRKSKYKNIGKVYAPHWSLEVFVIKKFKSTVLWTYIIEDLNGEEIVETFCEKELQKGNQTEFNIK